MNAFKSKPTKYGSFFKTLFLVEWLQVHRKIERKHSDFPYPPPVPHFPRLPDHQHPPPDCIVFTIDEPYWQSLSPKSHSLY